MQLNASIHKTLVEVFIESFIEPPKEIVLDFNAIDDPVPEIKSENFTTVITNIIVFRLYTYSAVNTFWRPI